MNEYQVYAYVMQIPYGQVSTYEFIARAIGLPNNTQQVIDILAKNPYAPMVPCHRVICSDGTLDLDKNDELFNEGLQWMIKYKGKRFNNFAPVADVTKEWLEKQVQIVKHDSWEPKPDAYYYGQIPPNVTYDELVKIMQKALIVLKNDYIEYMKPLEPYPILKGDLNKALDSWFEHDIDSFPSLFEHIVPDEKVDDFFEQVLI